MLLDKVTPDTTDYMILGYGLIFTVMLVYVWSLYRRANSLKKDLEVLEEAEK
jgi:CcmD family protein